MGGPADVETLSLNALADDVEALIMKQRGILEVKLQQMELWISYDDCDWCQNQVMASDGVVGTTITCSPT